MYKKIKPYMGEYLRFTRRSIVVITIAVILSVVPYFLLFQLISPLLGGERLTSGYVFLRVGMIALCLVGNAVMYVHGLDLSHLSAYNTLKNLRTALQGRLEQQPLGAIRELGNGRIKKVFTDDIETIELLLAHAIPEGIANLIIPAVVMIAMFFVDWKLALLSLASLPIGLLAMGMMFKIGMSRMGTYYAAAAKMNNTIIEYINGMEVVKVFNRDGESYARFENDINYYRDMTLDWYRICWPWMALYSSILPCVALFTLPIGGWFVLKGWSTLAHFVLVLCMTFAVGPPLLKAIGFAGKFPQLNYKVDELERLLDHPPLKQSERGFEGENHDISFEKVCFSYKDTEVIHGIDLKINEGSMVALVGESGSGKSTLAKLLVHFYDLDSGKITLGGQDIVILVETGLRISELYGLTTSDVDLVKRRVHVQRQLCRTGDDPYFITTPKSNSGVRTVPLSDSAYEAFRHALSHRVKPQIEMMIDGVSGFIFLDKDGRPKVAMHCQNYMRNMQKKYRKLCGGHMPTVTPHVLRHTFCTRMAQRELDPKSLQYVMGHSKPDITLNVYTHADYDYVEHAFRKALNG